MIYDIRPMRPDDAASLAALINHTIALGGSTAYEATFTPQTFGAEFLPGSEIHAARVAWQGGHPVGFQTLAQTEDALAIATFADQQLRRPGVGRALMAVSCAIARAFGAPFIQAVIRADNTAGLRFYRGQGFREHRVRRAVPLQDGTPVDRIVTRLPL